MGLSDVEWGTAPQAVSAVAALLAVVFGLLLLRRQLAVLRAQRRSAVDAQAHKVAVWVDETPVETLDSGLTVHVATVANTGDEAVYGVRLITPSTGDDGSAWSYGGGPDVLPAKDTRQVSVFRSAGQHRTFCRLTFMDSRGAHWRRDEYGRLERVPWFKHGPPDALILAEAERPWWRWQPRRRREQSMLQKAERPSIDY